MSVSSGSVFTGVNPTPIPATPMTDRVGELAFSA
jgi:hypothetical protein